MSSHRAAGRQLDDGRAASYLRHDALVEKLERLGVLAVQQALNGCPDVTSRLQGGGAKSRQYLPGFAVTHGRNVADGEDARVVFHLEVGTNRYAAAMHQFDA